MSKNPNDFLRDITYNATATKTVLAKVEAIRNTLTVQELKIDEKYELRNALIELEALNNMTLQDVAMERYYQERERIPLWRRILRKY